MSNTYNPRKFGIITTVSGVTAAGVIVNNVSTTDTVQTAQAQNEKGKILDIAAFSTNRQLSIDGLYTGSLSGTPAGSVISVGTISGLIGNTTITESNQDFVKCSLSVQTGEVDGSTVLHPVSQIQGS